jgi:adenosine deaminase CECR1
MSSQEIQEKIKKLAYDRKELIDEIKKPKYSDIIITDKDKKANELYHSKVVPGFKFPEDFHYDLAMKYKSDIEKNEFFKDLNNMPKGCLLHQHIEDCINIKWLSEEVMKKENLKYIYMRRFRDMYDILIYTKQPNETDKPFKDIIETYLKEHEGLTAYDYFHPRLSMLPEELEKVKSNDDAWSIFMPKYFFCYYLILYKAFYRQHIRNAFMQCIEDKQYRLESRLSPGRVRDENYTRISEDEEFAIYKEELEYVNSLNLETKFTFGIIVEMIRNKTDEVLSETIKKSIALRKKYPDLICAIDISGDENNFRTFQDLAPVMLTNDDQDLPWILHCGETIRASNNNLVDGVLIGAKRFGHCINLFKLGDLYDCIKNKGIVLEINPVSNQTLRQVRDLRIHPCIGYHNIGIKITINNDDPSIYNTKGVNYDFLIVAASMEFDLLDFKCFGLNSIFGAQISNDLKKEYESKFLNSWDKFLDYFINKYEVKI